MSAETQFIPPAASPRTILSVGNSWGTTFSVDGTRVPFPARMAAMLEFEQDDVINNNVNSESLATTITNIATRMPPSVYPANTGRPLVVILSTGGGVDISSGDSAATVYARIQTFVGLVRAVGGKVVLANVAPGQQFNGAAEIQRLALNVLIAADRTQYDWLWPVSELFPFPVATVTPAWYQTDNIHPSTFGDELSAHSVRESLQGRYDIPIPTYETLLEFGKQAGNSRLNTLTLPAWDGGAPGNGCVIFQVSATQYSLIGQAGTQRFFRLPIGGDDYFINSAGTVLVHINAGTGLATFISVKIGGIDGVNGTTVSCLRHGTATLVNGTVTVADTNTVTASRIFVNRFTDGGTIGDSYSVTRINATSFTITSKTANVTQALDTSVVSWQMINP